MSHETPHIADRADNDPREDPEALLIAALLWNRDTTQAVNLTQTLTPADFYSTDYAAIFATISQQLKSGRPYDPASVRTALHAEGDQSGILTDNIDGPGPRKVDTSGVSYAAWVSVAELSASKSSGARRLHQECRLRVL